MREKYCSLAEKVQLISQANMAPQRESGNTPSANWIAPRNEPDGYFICQILKLRRSHKIQGIAYMIFDVMLTSSRGGTGWLCPPGTTTSAVAADPCPAHVQRSLAVPSPRPGLWAVVHCGLVHQLKQATHRARVCASA